MKLVRSWPKKPPDNHPRIYDNCERVYIETVDYRPLLQLNDDVLHLDWDVSAGQDAVKAFARKCKAEPELVRVAPTMSYPTRQRRWHSAPGTPHRYMIWAIGDDGKTKIELPEGSPECNISSFGMIYLPQWTIAGFCAALEFNGYGDKFIDVNFCYWYYRETGRAIPVDWDTHTIHINFSMKDTLCDL
jgi:hypothetical protein